LFCGWLSFYSITQISSFFIFLKHCSLLEKKYNEQIRLLEEELQKEKETMASQSFLLRQDIAKELSTVQEQASKLRENINVMEQVLSIIKIF